jgi:hypothetical protein
VNVSVATVLKTEARRLDRAIARAQEHSASLPHVTVNEQIIKARADGFVLGLQRARKTVWKGEL